MRHDTGAPSDDALDRQPAIRIVGQRRIRHFLLNFKPTGLFVGFFRNSFVYIRSHEYRQVVLVVG